MLTFGSLFSGGGFWDWGMERAGWQCLWQCEKDVSARRVLAARFPGVPCHEDITTLSGEGLPAVTAVCGGSPCQNVSVAGERAGLAGAQSRLFHDFIRIADAVAARWLLWENVVVAKQLYILVDN